MSSKKPDYKAGPKPPRPAWWTPPPPPACGLCRWAVRVHGGLYCLTCEAHQRRAAAVARRVNAGRKVDRLSPAEERGRGI